MSEPRSRAVELATINAATARKAHWESIHQRKAPDRVSWYRPHLDLSLEFIERADLALDAAIIDVGGGSSTLVDDLVVRGYTNVTVLDISESAIEAAKARLGDKERVVRWLVADVTKVAFEAESYDLWHDRAVFHFLLQGEERRKYVAAARGAVKLGGKILVATFGPEGPKRCSDLEVVRYDADILHEEFGRDLSRLDSQIEMHKTPSGVEQQFVYCYFGVPGDQGGDDPASACDPR